ncbi:uncharacterized protein LOC5504865 [Nematostella vectensis]|uniref:uncharacterized protein LOC5504865 n=1 Tax=Nematostella vectensis TaxID=45351 RepID=UPI00207713F5|nr:uncharacterized protein LOC5504865 [Nematostella vectensis]
MASFTPLVLTTFVLAGLLFLPQGYGIMCENYVCSNSSHGPPQPCPTPNITECEQGMDRCSRMLTSYSTSAGKMQMTVHQDIRQCAVSYQCTPQVYKLMCEGMAQNGTTVLSCAQQCCEGNQCNNETFIPKPPAPPGPTNAPLQCYVCNSGPEGVMNSCDKAKLETCHPYGPAPAPRPDRCMTVKAIGKNPSNGEPMSFELRNCSSSMMGMCTNMCKMMNDTGALTSCEVNCCEGNGCNNAGLPTTMPTVRSHAIQPVIQVLVLIFAMIVGLEWSK